MTAHILTFPGMAQGKQPARLQVVEDDYSVKVESDADQRFWVRVERGDGDTVVVSDFIQGDLSENDLARGLGLAVRTLRAQDRMYIHFKDIVPGGTDVPRFAFRLERTAESLKRAARAIAADSGREMAGFAIRPRGAKMDAVAALS